MNIEQEWQEVLEKCGFKPVMAKYDNCYNAWLSPDGHTFINCLPPLTLDNLFKWVRPLMSHMSVDFTEDRGLQYSGTASYRRECVAQRFSSESATIPLLHACKEVLK